MLVRFTQSTATDKGVFAHGELVEIADEAIAADFVARGMAEPMEKPPDPVPDPEADDEPEADTEEAPDTAPKVERATLKPKRAVTASLGRRR